MYNKRRGRLIRAQTLSVARDCQTLAHTQYLLVGYVLLWGIWGVVLELEQVPLEESCPEYGTSRRAPPLPAKSGSLAHGRAVNELCHATGTPPCPAPRHLIGKELKSEPPLPPNEGTTKRKVAG